MADLHVVDSNGVGQFPRMLPGATTTKIIMLFSVFMHTMQVTHLQYLRPQVSPMGTVGSHMHRTTCMGPPMHPATSAHSRHMG